jgi:hypothetical protein
VMRATLRFDRSSSSSKGRLAYPATGQHILQVQPFPGSAIASGGTLQHDDIIPAYPGIKHQIEGFS